jgi:PAS domain S-box-containing protein
VLRDYAVLDTPPEQIFDDLTELAAHICEAPIALISLVDENRQWFKSRVGLTADETARDISFCGHAILQPALFIVPDATKDERFADNPLVMSEPHIRFYAGAPLVTSAGYVLGTLCVIDQTARQLNAWQQQALRVLSRLVITHLELRRKSKDLSSIAQTEKQLRQHLDMSEHSRLSLLSVMEDQQRAEEALRDREKQLSLITNNLPGIVSRVDRDLRYLFVNATYERWFGSPPEAILGRTVPEVIGEESFQRAEPHTKRVLAGEQVTFENLFKLSSGGILHGLTTYVPDFDPNGQVKGFFILVTDITERKRAEHALAQAEARYRYLLNSSPSVIYATKADSDLHQCVFVNDTLVHLTGYTPQAMLNDPQFWFTHVHPDDVQQTMSEIERQMKEGEGTLEYRFRHKDSEYRWIRDTFRIIPDAGGQPIEVVGSWTDITDSRHMEQQLAQSQKMEAVGQLTGGIAHDFNNRLTVIMGNLELLQRRLGNDSAAMGLLKSALTATSGAAELTRRLLTFSRQQVLEPTLININELVAGMHDMLQRTLGETINIVMSPGQNLWPVMTDRHMLENVLLNLAVNARDAMPAGGQLTIETSNIALDETYVEIRTDTVKGDHVLLSVSDTGTGMSEEIRQRAFEPFFTTKDEGKGTGLGLSMVYGFVKQSGGHIEIYSEPGDGTSFKIYFTRAGSAAGVASETPARDTGDEDAAMHGKIILLVEDDETVRDIGVTLLTDMGCRVLIAGSGPAALELFMSHPEIDLLFTDMKMPGGMTGVDLAAKLREYLPELRVLYTSGYAPQAAADRRTIEHPNDFWLAKPYRLLAFRDAVRRALGGKA